MRLDSTQTYIKIFSKLYDSNSTPPVSKIQAVVDALSSDNWSSSVLKEAKLDVRLYYMSYFVDQHGDTSEYEFLKEINSPLNDYSPKAEYNVTVPGLMPRLRGTMWYRYVWVIELRIPGSESLAPAGYYLVDAITGRLIPHGTFF